MRRMRIRKPPRRTIAFHRVINLCFSLLIAHRSFRELFERVRRS